MKTYHECLNSDCNSTIVYILHSNTSDGLRCPKCNGPTSPCKPKIYRASDRGYFVRRKIVEGDLDHCRGLTPEQVDTILKLGDEFVDLDEISEPPLLRIELADIDSAPSVFYKGEEINKKIRVFFDYGTDTDEYLRPTYIHIEHFDTDSEKKPNTKIIQHNHLIEE